MAAWRPVEALSARGLTFPTQAVRLPNGLRVAVETSDTRGLLGTMLVVNAGSAGEPAGQEGLAHLTEHLMFHTRFGAKARQADRLARLGAEFNATTTTDVVSYTEVAPTAALPGLLEIARERLVEPLAGVTEADFAKERAIVINELRQRSETGVPGAALAWMQRALFSTHAYGRPTGGDEASLSRLTLGDVRRFVHDRYAGSGATLVIVTPQKGDSTLDLAKSVLGALKGTRSERESASVSDPLPLGRLPSDVSAPARLAATVATPEIWIAYRLPSVHGNQGAETQVLLSDAAASAVAQRLRGDADVTAVKLHIMEWEHATLAAWHLVLGSDRRRDKIADRARKLIWAVWSDAGPPAAVRWASWQKDAVTRFRRTTLAATLFEAEPFSTRVDARAESLHLTGDPHAYEQRLARIEGLQPAAPSALAFDWLAPERAHTLYVDPSPSDAPVSGGVGLVGANEPVRTGDQTAGVPVVFPRPVPPPPPVGWDQGQSRRLPNGLTVVVVPHGNFPGVTALLGFPGGAAALPAGMMELVRGVETRTSDRVGDETLATEPLDDDGYTADVVRTRPANLGRALYLLAHRLRTLADVDWTAYVSALNAADAASSRNQRAEKTPEARAADVLRGWLYGAHPYARAGDRLAAAKLRADGEDSPLVWLPRLYQPAQAVLVITGAVDAADAFAEAELWLGSWQGAPGLTPAQVPAVRTAEPSAEGDHVRGFARAGATQVMITCACPLPAPVAMADAVAYRAAAAMLGTRFNQRLREDAGVSYGVSSQAVLVPGAAHLVARTAVDAAALSSSLRTLRTEMRRLGSGKADQALLSQVVWSLAREVAREDETALQLAVALFEAETKGFGWRSVGTEGPLVAGLAGATGSRVAEALVACAQRPLLTLVGPPATLARELTGSDLSGEPPSSR